MTNRCCGGAGAAGVRTGRETVLPGVCRAVRRPGVANGFESMRPGVCIIRARAGVLAGAGVAGTALGPAPPRDASGSMAYGATPPTHHASFT